MTDVNRILYSDDCLNVLRDPLAIPPGSVDLIYLDPPFNSKNHYNLPFTGQYAKDARPVEAFNDLWTWGVAEDKMLADLDAGPMTRTLANIVRLAADVEQGRGLSPTYRLDAYLINMAVRLIEMRQVLSSTGSIYLHCDDAASHYLKLLMDVIFGRQNFRNEIIWKRTYAHSDAKQGRKQPGRIHDSLLFYTKSDEWTWNTLYVPHDKDYVDKFYKYTEEGTGRPVHAGQLDRALRRGKRQP